MKFNFAQNSAALLNYEKPTRFFFLVNLSRLYIRLKVDGFTWLKFKDGI